MNWRLNLRPRGALVAGVLLLMGLARPAYAQTAEAKAGARAAATQGLDAFAAKRYGEALDLFTRAESLMHAPTHVLMIARAQAALGRLVRARESYVALGRETLAANAPPAFKQAQADGKKELEALEPRVPSIDVKLSDPAAKVTITMDGEPLPAALVGIPHPVDPGEHVLKAQGDKHVSDEKSVRVEEGGHVVVVLQLRPSADATTGPATPPPSTAPVQDKPEQGPPPGRGLAIAGYVGIGLGVVGVGLGAVFTGLGFAKRGEADDAYTACGAVCVDGSPGAENVKSLDDDANTKQTIGLVGLIAGGALAATGVTLLVLSPKADDKSQTGLSFGPGSVRVHGTF